jgi:hypothetical protein
METKHGYTVGEGVCWNGYSDVRAGTVVRVSNSRVYVVEDNARLLNGFDSGEPDALTVSIGGFAAHVTGEQRYEFSPGNGPELLFTARKGGRVVMAGCADTTLGRGRVKHYDYNF